MKKHLVTLGMHRRIHTSATEININQVHAESMSRLDRIAKMVTDRIGTFGTFLSIAGWTVCWLGWNVLAPHTLRFDPAPAFVLWLFISNMIQICLMPLIMIGQTLEARHSDIRGELDYHINQEAKAQLDRHETMLAEILDTVKFRSTLQISTSLLADTPPMKQGKGKQG